MLWTQHGSLLPSPATRRAGAARCRRCSPTYSRIAEAGAVCSERAIVLDAARDLAAHLFSIQSANQIEGSVDRQADAASRYHAAVLDHGRNDPLNVAKAAQQLLWR